MAADLFERLKKVGKLPTPPGVVLRLLELTRKDDVSLREITDTIGLDPALTAKILKFANSPMAGLPRKVTSLQQGVSLVGIRGVKMMALSFSVLGSDTADDCPGFDQQLFWGQSLGCGVAAKKLATITGSAPPEEAFMAGLLSQIGRSLLASAVATVYAKIMASTSRVPIDLPEKEEATLGETYVTVGAKLLKEWGLSEQLVTAVATFRSLDAAPEPPTNLAKILCVAEIAATIMCPDPRGTPPERTEFCTAIHQHLGIKEEQANSVLTEIAHDVEDMRQLMEMPKGNIRSPEDIEAEIRERVAELNLATHMESQQVLAQHEDLLRRATTDKLTGLKNRAAFDERLALEIDRAVRTGSALALMMIDVDKFKLFNDTHGHQAGDRVLQVVGQTLDDSVRKVDFVARYGGEEFAVIAPDTKPTGVVGLAQRLRESVEEASVEWEDKQLQVTISIGVTILTKAGGSTTSAELIRMADEQLYAAKENGRNRVEASLDGRPARAAATV